MRNQLHRKTWYFKIRDPFMKSGYQVTSTQDKSKAEMQRASGAYKEIIRREYKTLKYGDGYSKVFRGLATA